MFVLGGVGIELGTTCFNDFKKPQAMQRLLPRRRPRQKLPLLVIRVMARMVRMIRYLVDVGGWQLMGLMIK